jgi:gamma-glutamyl-gamma-aminobutyrate hydrolase PuuD
VPGEFAVHPVEIRDGSRLAGIVGVGSQVTSHHHQALGKVGAGLVETAWAADGTLEAVEDPSLRFAVGVQWHPEAGEDAALFEALVEQAREYRAARAQ